MSYIITKSGYTEVDADPVALAMDLNISNRGKSPEDCEYVVEASPERYKVTSNGLENKSLAELVNDGVESLDTLKAQKKAEIKAAYQNERVTGYKGIMSSTLGVKIDCRESDVQNIQSLIYYLEANGITEYFYKCYDNTEIPCTLTQMKAVLAELIAGMLSMWGLKNALTKQIDNCTTVEQVDAITWNY
jgi:hypothetical protein